MLKKQVKIRMDKKGKNHFVTIPQTHIRELGWEQGDDVVADYCPKTKSITYKK